MEYAEYDMSKKAEAIEALRLIELRDEFAMRASEDDVKAIMFSRPRHSITRQQARYIHADAMLEARK